MTRQLHLGGFEIASHVAHSHAAWRHPGSDLDFFRPEYWHRVGRTLERGLFDFVFFADLLAVPTNFGDDEDEALRRGTQASATLDPALVTASIAAVTRHLGVAITKSTTYFHPFEVARIFATLDHLSGGRAAWNIVTSLSRAEARNFGFDQGLDHDLRYDRAQEFVEVAVALWESWEPDAPVGDKVGGVFADPAKVHRVDHDGRFYKTRGPLPTPRSPQGRPVLMQAGSSGKGKDFAARWADVIFEIDPTSEGRRAYYDDVKSRADNAGRNPDDVAILPSFIPFVGETASIAREKQAFHEVGKLYAQGVLLPQFVGTASDVADEIEAVAANGEADGFILSAAQSPATFDDFVDQVVPELQRRKLFREEYTGGTLRENLGLGDR